MEAMTEDLRRAMKLPDAGRPIDPEAARAAIRTMQGVRSVAWLDRSNLLVRVTGAEFRSYRFIDQVCQQLEPLGDTLAVAVHLRNANPRTRDEADSLGRNCQLAPGDVALLQRERKVDSLDPAMRARFRADTERGRVSGSRPPAAGDRAALDAIPDMCTRRGRALISPQQLDSSMPQVHCSQPTRYVSHDRLTQVPYTPGNAPSTQKSTP